MLCTNKSQNERRNPMNTQPLASSQGLGTAFLQPQAPMNHISLAKGTLIAPVPLLPQHSGIALLICVLFRLLFSPQLHESTLLLF